MNVHGVIECKRGNDVRQAEIYVAEPHVSQPSAFEIELKIEKLKVTNHRVWIKFEKNWLRQGVEQFTDIRNLLILYGKKDELPEEWEELFIVPIYKKDN